MRQQVPGIGRAIPPRGAAVWDALWLKAMEWGRHTGCHQDPQRSFFVFKRQLPVCARCLGLGVGHVAALPLALLLRPRMGAALLALPLAADGVTQRLGLRRSNNPLRFATGLLAGWGMMTALLGAVRVLLRAARGMACRKNAAAL